MKNYIGCVIFAVKNEGNLRLHWMFLFTVCEIKDEMHQFNREKIRVEAENKCKRESSDEEGKSDAKRMRQEDGFLFNMAWKSVHGHAPKIGGEYQG